MNLYKKVLSLYIFLLIDFSEILEGVERERPEGSEEENFKDICTFSKRCKFLLTRFNLSS